MKSEMLYEFSAGGVLFRGEQVLLIKNPSGVWTFPKGLVEKGEDPSQTAVREVWEETGIRGEVLQRVGDVEYWYHRDGKRIKKKVTYFIMKYTDGETKPSWEVMDAKFFPLHEAKRLLKYRGDKDIFNKALYILGKLQDGQA